METQKTTEKTQKEKRENTKKIYYLNSEKTMKTFFYCSQKNGFWERRKHKKTTPPSPNKFFVFFVFKNRKSFLKIGTKQALRLLILIFQPNVWLGLSSFYF